MNKAKKNIVVVTDNFTDAEIKCLSIPCTISGDGYLDYAKINYVKELEEVKKYQGYLLIINNNRKNENVVILDKKYRKVFNKFKKILIYNEKYKYSKQNNWNGFEKIGREIFDSYSDYLTDEWINYKKEVESNSKKQIKYNKDKKEKLDSLYNYIKKYKTRKTTDIEKDLNINKRNIERYMFDLNMIYHNIGYDYSNNEWYFIW